MAVSGTKKKRLKRTKRFRNQRPDPIREGRPGPHKVDPNNRPGRRPGSDIFKTDLVCDQFADEYVKTLNGKEAALKVGYRPQSAAHAASKLLQETRVRDRIAFLRRKMQRKTEVSVERVIRELAIIAFSDIRDYVLIDGNGEVVLSRDGFDDPDLSPAIAEINIQETGSGKRKRRKGKIRLHDKVGALVDLGKHLGMWPHKRADWNALNDDDPDANAAVEIHIKGGLPARITQRKPEEDEKAKE